MKNIYIIENTNDERLGVFNTFKKAVNYIKENYYILNHNFNGENMVFSCINEFLYISKITVQ